MYSRCVQRYSYPAISWQSEIKKWTKILQWLIRTYVLTIQVLALSPMKESRKTNVSLLALNGKWAFFLPSARIHSSITNFDEWNLRTLHIHRLQSKKWYTFKANKLLLISAPSIRVVRSDETVSAPLSLPAKSIKENFPCNFLTPLQKFQFQIKNLFQWLDSLVCDTFSVR